MPTQLDEVLWELDEPVEHREEPSVLVDPALEAFCVMRTRMPRGSVPPPTGSGRLPMDLILRYMAENSDPEE